VAAGLKPASQRGLALLGRNQSEKDLTTDVTDHTDRRSETPLIRAIGEIRGCSFFGDNPWPQIFGPRRFDRL
jgi:hypothetical protein